MFHHSLEITRQQTSVGEGYIGKPRRGNRETAGVCHNHLFHDFLTGSHDINRIGSLIRGNAEEMLRGGFSQLA